MVTQKYRMNTSEEWRYWRNDALNGPGLRRKQALAYIEQQRQQQQQQQQVQQQVQQQQVQQHEGEEEEVEVCALATEAEVRDGTVRLNSLRTLLLHALPRRANRRIGSTAVALPIARAGEEVYNLFLCGANEGVRELCVGLSGRLCASRLWTLMEECELDWAAVDEYMRAPIALRRLARDVWTPQSNPPSLPSPQGLLQS